MYFMFKVYEKKFIYLLVIKIIHVIVLVAPKLNYRAAYIQNNNSFYAKYWVDWETYLAQADREKREEAVIYARQNGVGSNPEKYGLHHANVQTKFVELIAECREQVENLRVSGAGTGSGTFGTHATGYPEWC